MDREPVTEGATTFQVPAGRGQASRGPAQAGAGFYNPAMALTRDLSVLLARTAPPHTEPTMLDGLAAAGARGLRVAHEAPGWQVNLNDHHPQAAELARENAASMEAQVAVTCQDLNALAATGHWSYLEVDPYGSPVPFLSLAVRAVRWGGYLGISATDTTALHGVKAEVARRRYLAEPPPRQAPGWKAAAARLLVGHVVRVAGQFDLAAEPVLTHEHQHAFRSILRITKGVAKAEAALGQLEQVVLCPACQRWGLEGCACGAGRPSGPYWMGPLVDATVVDRMLSSIEEAELAEPTKARRLLTTLSREAELDPFYLDIPQASSVLDVDPPGRQELIEALEAAGLPAGPTAFSPEAVAYAGEVEAALEVMAGLRGRPG